MPLPRGPPAGCKVTLAVVGDVHSQWDADDEAALDSLGADVAVFVGDFGEEDVQMIRRIAALRHPKAVMLGNHDAWFSLTPGGRRRYARAMLKSSSLAAREEFTEGGSTPAIAAQLAALGGEHIGYSSKRFPGLGLTLLGARPFSKGGKQWSDVADFYAEHYGVGGHRDSALRLLDRALAAEEGDCKVVVAHNGPAGLGGRRHSICGVDWTEPEADFGDPDLQEGLDMMCCQGVHTPLVLFGHMHSQLSGGGDRNMVEVDPRSGTVYLNAAAVPRIRNLPVPPAGGAPGGLLACEPGGGGGIGDGSGEKLRGHHFMLVELCGGVVMAARDVWVGVQHAAQQAAVPAAAADAHSSSGCAQGDGGTRCVVLRQQELLRTAFPPADPEPAAAGAAAPAAWAGEGRETRLEAAARQAALVDESGCSYVCSIYRAHTREWQPLVLQLPRVAAAQQGV